MDDSSRHNYKRTLITAALPYANGPVHIGHIAGVYLPADIYSRYKRLNGEEMLFVCGSDEHGVPITIRARKEGITPQQVVDKYHKINQRAFEAFGISFDIFSRTSNKMHRETSSDFFLKLHEKLKFIEIEQEQFFDAEVGTFLADRYIKGTCPHCGYDSAYGDQCENCGTDLSPAELVQPRSMLSGSKPSLKPTKHWYLPLEKYQNWLQDWIVNNHKEWKPNVYGQCKSWIDQGLQSRAVTRDLDWGVPVPLPNTDGKVLYVWFDAPIGYISATKELAEQRGFNWETWWKDKSTRLIHFIGKDNIVFHCIIFPVMLKEYGEFILPDNVPAFEFLNLEGNKISTSRNWAVWLHEYIEDFPGKQDVLRYVLCSNAPESKDNDFIWSDFQSKNNNELVAIFGNFVNRTMVLVNKYFNGKVPARNILYDIDTDLLNAIAQAPKKIGESLENFRFREALNHLMDLARSGNKYLTETEPWKEFKTSPLRVQTILNLCLETTAALKILCAPFMPFTSVSLGKLLNIDESEWNLPGNTILMPIGHKVEKEVLLFEKIDDAAIEAQKAKLEKSKLENKFSADSLKPLKPGITAADFSKLDFRVGTVIAAEVAAGSKKLLKLTVDTTLDKRTIVSGIALYYKPEDLIGKQVVIIANLIPREIRGIKSEGMLMVAENLDGSAVIVSPESQVFNGSIVA